MLIVINEVTINRKKCSKGTQSNYNGTLGNIDSTWKKKNGEVEKQKRLNHRLKRNVSMDDYLSVITLNVSS